MAQSTKDRITRYASPSRYDSTVTPQSFLDARKKRSASRDSLDKKTDSSTRVTPSRDNGAINGQTLGGDQCFRNNVPMRTPRPPVNDNRDSDGIRLHRQVESLETRVRTMRQNRNVYINSPTARADVDGKLNNSLSVDTHLSHLNHSHALPDFSPSKSANSFDNAESPEPSVVDLCHRGSIDQMNNSVNSERSDTVTINTNSTRRPEITKINSRVHKRILIQTGSTTQAKTFTYQNYPMGSNSSGLSQALLTSTHSGQESVSTGDRVSLYPCSNDSNLADSDLDHLAMHMGLLKAGVTPASSSAVASHLSTPSHLSNMSENPMMAKRSATTTITPVNGSLSHTDSEIPSVSQLSSNKGTPHKRTRTGGILSGLLRRFSPGINRRSKSFSPTRMRLEGSSTSNGLQGLPENCPINMEDSGKHSPRHSRSNSHEQSEASPMSTGSYSGGKISRLFRNKRFHKKNSPSHTSTVSEGTGEKHSTLPSRSGKDRILMESLTRDRINNPYEQMKQHQRSVVSANNIIGGNDSSTPTTSGTASRHSISSSCNTNHSGGGGGAVPLPQGSVTGAMRVVYQSGSPKPLDLSQHVTDPEEIPEPITIYDSEATPTPTPKQEHFLLKSTLDPPRYLGVSISAFGYSAYGYKAIHSQSEQTKTPALESKPKEDLKNDTEHNATPMTKDELSNNLSRRSTYKGSSTLSQTTSDAVSLRNPDKRDSECNDQNASAPETVELRRRDRTRSTSEEKEARKRSSLIIMQVAQASPRSRYNTSSTDFSTFSLPRSVTSERPQSTGISPLITPTTIGISFLEHLQPIGEVSNTIVEDEALIHFEDIATPRSLSIGTSSSLAVPPSNLDTSDETDQIVSDEKDGKYFLHVVAGVESQLIEELEIVEKDLGNPEVQQQLSEEVDGQLRTAIGKANLLINDKFAQFRGLCDENLYQRAQALSGAAPSSDSHFVTLSSDLEGFWAMVQLQVEDIMRMFQEIKDLRSRDWKPLPKEEPIISTPRRRQPAHKKKATTEPSAGDNKVKEKDNTRAIEARKRLIAAKKEAMMKLKQNNTMVNDELVIFH